MRSYEKIIIVGNIGTAEKIQSKAGNTYLRMSVAVNRSTGTQKSTAWYSVVIFGKMAENVDRLVEVFSRGRLVLVEGRPQVEPYLKNDGKPGVDNSIVAEKLPVLMDEPPQQRQPQVAAQRAAA